VKIVHEWLAELADIPPDAETVAREISLRGFEVAGVDAGVIDFEITANRPDCLSHRGFAREAAVIWPRAARQAAGAAPGGRGTAGEAPAVTIEAPDLCPRYCAQRFDVQVGPSPGWLTRRLEAAGVRAINNVVDVTNYVMLEIGQPMHAFDLDRLEGERLVIRRARAGETLRTLDGVDRALDDEMLAIADAARPVAIGGVMGGADSEIGAATTRMVIESAYFHPASVRRTSKRLGLKTEASTRFERGGDIDAPLLGLLRAAALLEQLGAATPGRLVDVYPAPRTPARIRLRASRIARVLGRAVERADVPRILEPLGFVVHGDGADAAEPGWLITVPSFRVDVTREVDLIEEVGRHVGFDTLPTTFPVLAAAQAPPDPRIGRDRRARQVLMGAGFSESLTFAFIERAAAMPFVEPGTEPAALANPLSEKFAVLRPSLLPGLVDSCAHNRRRGRKDVRLFESGSIFPARGEARAVAFCWLGAAEEAHWSGSGRPVDFFDAKGVVTLLCSAFAPGEPEAVPAERPYLVGGRTADLRLGERPIGVVGQLAPDLAEARGLPPGEPLYVAELDLEPLGTALPGEGLRAEPLPRHPAIVRDVSLLLDEALPAAAVRGTIRATAPETLASVVEFDRYQGTGIPEGRVSLSLRLTFRSADRTLTDDEVQAAMDRIVAALVREHGAEQR
jgi:phenylalanyl-tRNA synthetase beta chain